MGWEDPKVPKAGRRMDPGDSRRYKHGKTQNNGTGKENTVASKQSGG